MMRDMANLTLIYGLRLLPEGEVTEIQDATLKLANGHQAHVTMHTIEEKKIQAARHPAWRNLSPHGRSFPLPACRAKSGGTACTPSP